MQRDRDYHNNKGSDFGNFNYENYQQSSKNGSKTSKMNFLQFLGREVPYEYKFKKLKVRKSPHEPLSFEIDDGHRFRNTVSINKSGSSTIHSLSNSSRNTGIREYAKKKQLETDLSKQFNESIGSVKQVITAPIEVVDWESEVFVSGDKFESVQTKEYINELLDSGWEKYIYYDKELMPLTKKYMTLFIDDPNLIFEKIEDKKSKIKKKFMKSSANDKPAKSRYNISNDKYYVSETKNKVSLGTFGVQHALPALKLDPKFYKTNHTKEELRNFHRPVLALDDKTFTFKNPSKSNFVGSVVKKSHELTLTDTLNFSIFEYYEEHPFFVTNPGMASLVNTYYRRIDSSDEPTVENCVILDLEDEAPFFGFGEIKPGTYMKTLDNNLFTSPIFQHKSNDFLCILDHNEIVMRPIGSINLVGQEFPKEEVFAPHSRKLNQFCKDRLKVAAYRIFAKGKNLLMQQLDQMFPYFSEGSKRKWLKEYCDSEKKGKDNVWVLKDSFSIIGEEDLRKLVTPENICQYESMLSSERRLQDLGYKFTETDEEDEEYELFSPSWYLSRNFVNATNGKGLLELSQTSDVSSAGDTFSFRKIKLKKGNESENRRIIAEHQSTYKERIVAIWNNHLEALSLSVPPTCILSQKKPTFEAPSETTATDMMLTVTIKRIYDEKGIQTIKYEKLVDSRIIKAYMRARKVVKIDEKKATFTCSSCGQVGHMKTNKTCPNFIGSTKQVKRKVEDKKAIIVFQEKLLKLVSSFMGIPFSSAFHRPVSLKKFPNYALIIKNPIDLGTIKNKIKLGSYTKYNDFLSDLRLMRDNCILYNGASHSLTEISQNIFDQAANYFYNNTAEIKILEESIEKNQ